MLSPSAHYLSYLGLSPNFVKSIIGNSFPSGSAKTANFPHLTSKGFRVTVYPFFPYLADFEIILAYCQNMRS